MEQKGVFGTWLKQLRKSKGLSQEELADRIKKSADAISNIERGHSLPSFEMISALSGALGVQPNEMFAIGATNESSRRAELRAKLSALGHSLDDDDLALAVAQVEAIVDRSSKR